MGPNPLSIRSVRPWTHLQMPRHVRGCQSYQALRPPRCCAGKGFGAAPVSQEPLIVNKKTKSGKELKRLGKWINEELSSVSVVIVGDDTTFNEGLVAAMSPVLEYTPLCTAQLLKDLTGNTVQTIVDDEGADSLGVAEAAVVESLSTYLRCCIATCGGGIGAAARSACWRHLYGAVTVWLDIQGSGEKDCLQNDAYRLADLHVKISIPEDDESNTSELAKATMKEVLPAVETLLKKDKELCKKKALYVRLGCRGDWPNLKPPEWNPDSEPQS